MADQTLQRVFVRVFSYLAESGVEMTRSRSRTLLQLMDDTLAESGQPEAAGRLSETDLLVQTMDRLPAYFPIEEEALPAPNPPLCRGSIGYPTHG